jgi:4-hydroxybenzoate polyprenyltransferase
LATHLLVPEPMNFESVNVRAVDERLGADGSTFAALLECARPIEWVKNSFVLAPLLFSTHLNQGELVLSGLMACIAFCLAASGIYLWNDLVDWRADLAHPEKKTRPIPSGRLSVATAAISGTLILISGVAVGLRINAPTGLLLCSYVGVNLLYSRWLKHVPILDFMCIALGFVLRVLAGATAVHVQPSHWLLMCTFLLALSLAVAKRRQELVMLDKNSSNHRRVLDHYSLPWLDQVGTALAGATIVAYALYTVSLETQERFGTDRLIYTLPFVIYGILRYLHLVHTSDRTGNPSRLLVSDRPLLICVSVWALICTAIIYL